MNAVIRIIGAGLLPLAVVIGVGVLLLAGPARAASIDEIMAMQDAGIPADTIIDVIDATGLDDPLDSDTVVWLVDNDLDPDILGYLIENYYVDSDTDSNKDDYDNDSGENDAYSNMRGGEGFHGGSGYNPLRNDERNDNYRSDNYRNDNYYRNGYYPGNYYSGIYVYEPPVYMLENRPYHGAYRAPRFYNSNTGYWNNGYYVINGDGNRYHRYDPYRDSWYGNRMGHGYGYGNLYGDWSWSGRRHHWDLGGDVRYWEDGLRLRISF